MDHADAEAAVLGACLVDSGCIGEVADYLKPVDFYSEQNRLIYEAMLDLWALGDPVSETTVTSALRSNRKLKTAGGAAYVSYLSGGLPDVGNTVYYAEQVKEGSLSRRLKAIGKLLQSANGKPHDLLNDTMEQLVDASASSLRSIPRTVGQYADEVTARAIAISEGKSQVNAIKTGMPRIDAITTGLKPSDLIVIGAQPSIGKSAFSLWIAKSVAEQGMPVLFVSLEMSGEQIGTRLLAAESGLNYSWIQGGHLNDMAKEQLRDATTKIRTLPLVIDDKAGQSISDIRTKARREQVRGGLSLLIVDYLQIACSDPSDVGQVAMVSTGLKNIAKDLKIPVIALSQMSRNIEHREDKEPVLADLKQSSQVEQDADLVAFMYYKSKRDRQNSELTFMVKKHRNGSLGWATLKFEKDNQRFHDIDGKVG